MRSSAWIWRLHWVWALAFFISLSIFIYRIPLFQTDPHFMEVSRDLFVPISLDNLIGQKYPMWSDILSVTNFVASFQIAVLGLLVLGKALQMSVMTTVLFTMATATTFFGFFGYLAAYEILSKTYGSSKRVILASLLAGFVLVVNPHWAADPRHYARKMADSFVPLMFLLFWVGLRDKRFSYIIAGSIVMVVATAGPRNAVMAGSLFVGLAILAFASDVLRRRPDWKNVLKTLLTYVKLCLSAGLLYLIFTAYALLPLVERVVSVGFPSPYLITIESAQRVMERSTLINSMRFDIYPRLHAYTNPPSILNGPLGQVTFTLGFLLFCSALAVIFIGPVNRDTVVLLVNLVGWTVFSTGVNPYGFPYVSNLYWWLILSAPFHQYYFWAFRKPIEFWPLPIMFTAFLLGFLSVRLFGFIKSEGEKVKFPRLRRAFGVILLIVLLLSITLPSWPILTGNFGGVLQPVHVPDEYFTLNKWLADQPGDFKVLWFPIYRASNVSWIQGQVPDMGTALYLKNFDEVSSSRGTYSVWVTNSKGRPSEAYEMYLLSMNYGYRFDLMQSNRTLNLSQFIGPLNIRYVILDLDIPPTSARQSVINFLSAQRDLKFVFQMGIFLVYENLNYNPHIYVTGQTILVDGGRDTLAALSNLQSFNSDASSTFFLDGQIAWNMSLFNYSRTIFLHDWRDMLPFVDPSDAYSLTKYTDHEPQLFHSFWAKAEGTEIRYGRFMPILATTHIPNWDLDYGLGYVFTDRRYNELTFPVRIQNGGDYTFFLRYLPSNAGGAFNVFLDGDEISTVRTRSNATRMMLLNLGNESLLAGTHSVTIENVVGFNAFNFIMAIPQANLDLYYNQISDLLADKQQVYLELPGLDFQNVNANVTSEYGGRAMNGWAMRFDKNGRALTFLEPITPGEYRIAISSPPPQSGVLSVQIGNSTFTIAEGSGQFVYTPPFYLGRQHYTLLISQSSGRPVVDGVFIYRAGQNTTIDELFKTYYPAKVVGFVKVDPTRYDVTVDAKEPFLLYLAESYDPSWVAQVNGRSIPSILAYQSINAFPINVTGKLQISLVFSLQTIYNYGVIVDVIALIAAAVIIVRDLRRSRKMRI